MPTVIVKSIEAFLVLLFGFSILTWSLPGRDSIQVDIKTFQNEAYYGVIDFQGQLSYLEIREAGEGKVKISFRRKGDDINLFYERGQEITDMDQVVIEKILSEIEKKPSGVIQQRLTNTLKNILNRPSKSKKRGMVGKFLP